MLNQDSGNRAVTAAKKKSSVNGGHVGHRSLAEHYAKEMVEMGRAPTVAADKVGGYAIRAADKLGGAAIAGDVRTVRAANAVGGAAINAANTVGGYAERAANDVGGAAIALTPAAQFVSGVEKAVDALRRLGRHGNAVGPDDALGAGRSIKR